MLTAQVLNTHTSQAFSLIQGLCRLARLLNAEGVRHPIDLHMQDLTLVAELHDHARLVTLLVEGHQLHAAAEYIQNRAGRQQGIQEVLLGEGVRPCKSAAQVMSWT